MPTPPHPSQIRSGPTRAEIAALGAFTVLLGLIAFLAVWARQKPAGDPVKTDQRALATALETYFVDHEAYPPMAPLRDYARKPEELRKAGGWHTMTASPGTATVAGLTSPVAYMRDLFPDPYSPGKRLPFAYYTDGPGWILYSPGPDEDYDIRPAQEYDGRITQPSARLLLNAYDPMNGIRSGGDVFRVKE